MKITICGAGSWGSALAHVVSDKHDVVLWNHLAKTLKAIEIEKQNSKYLPGVCLDKVNISLNLKDAIMGSDMIVIAIPTSFLRDFSQHLKQWIKKDQILVSASKGLESKTNLLATEIIASEIGEGYKVATLSGPSHAEEVGLHKPTAVTAACDDFDTALLIQNIFMTSYLRVYVSTDIKGVELGGAIKNVIAIAAGIVDGLDLGSNTMAALLTRGLVEMRKIGTSLGGKSETFYGLSGLGDLVVTCTSKFSRNRQVGFYLANGYVWEDIQKKMDQVSEGVPTCRAIYQFSMDTQIEIPICSQVYQVLFENKNPKQAVLDLMMRNAQIE